MSMLALVVTVLGAQRILELLHARANTRRLLARGAMEVGARHYVLFVLLHTAWLASMLWLVPSDAEALPAPLAALGGLMVLRVWVMASLGPFWTTRILTLPGAPLVRRGPYRWVRHPNYWVVAGEIALLPVAFGAYDIAIVFSVLNGALLAWRIFVEERALAPRLSARGSSAASG